MTEKVQLYNACLANIDKRIGAIQKGLDAAIAAGNEQTKSSVGDKHETGRALMQLEQEKYQAQLLKAIHLKNELQQIDVDKKYNKIEKGALAITNFGHYFISTSIGKIIIENKTYYAISSNAPLSKALVGNKINDVVFFQNRKYNILNIL